MSSFRSLFLKANQNTLFEPAVYRTLPYALGKDPSSHTSSELTEKLDPKAVSVIDKRPISLRFRVSSLIQLCELDKAAQISRLGLLKQYRAWDTEVMMFNEIIGAMCADKRYGDAMALFDHFFNKGDRIRSDIVSFNHIIKVMCDKNRVDEALQLYSQKYIAVFPNIDTRRLLAKGLLNTGRIYEAVEFVRVRKLYDSVLYSYLIRGFLDLGNHDMAYELFDELNRKTMPGRNRALVDATIVDYWLKQGEDEKAMDIYRSLISRKEALASAATGNALLEMLLDNGKLTEAWDLFNVMITNSKTFDRDTFGTMVNACFRLGHFKEALDTFKMPELTRSSRCYANIIAQFCEHGMMSEAQTLFAEFCSDQYLCPDVTTFRSMINGYAKAGMVDEAIEMLKKMVDATLLKFAVHEAH